MGAPLTQPRTLVSAVDALRPQRVSGALDETTWPSVLPTPAEAWTGEPRFVVRRDGVELFCRFVVTDIAVGDAGVAVTASDAEQGVEIAWTCEMRDSGLVRQRARTCAIWARGVWRSARWNSVSRCRPT